MWYIYKERPAYQLTLGMEQKEMYYHLSLREYLDNTVEVSVSKRILEQEAKFITSKEFSHGLRVAFDQMSFIIIPSSSCIGTRDAKGEDILFGCIEHAVSSHVSCLVAVFDDDDGPEKSRVAGSVTRNMSKGPSNPGGCARKGGSNEINWNLVCVCQGLSDGDQILVDRPVGPANNGSR